MTVKEALKITAPKQPYRFYQDNILQDITKAIAYNPSSFAAREITRISLEDNCIIYHV